MVDRRTYIKVHDGIVDHPKVEGLSDRSFRLLIETWCWCSRHLTDGQVPRATWIKRGTAKARSELITAGLADDRGEVVVMHDYTEHQRSAAEVETRRAVKQKAGAKGNHQRWHTGPNGTPDPSCEHCVLGPGPIPPGNSSGSQVTSHVDRTCDSQSDRLEVEVEVKKVKTFSEADASGAAAPSEDRQPALMLVTATDPVAGPVTARDVTAAWVNACRENHTEPTTRQKAQVGKTAKELLAKNDPQRVLAAAAAAGAKGYEQIDRELTAMAGKTNSRRNGHVPFKSPPSDEYVVGGLI